MVLHIGDTFTWRKNGVGNNMNPVISAMNSHTTVTIEPTTATITTPSGSGSTNNTSYLNDLINQNIFLQNGYVDDQEFIFVKGPIENMGLLKYGASLGSLNETIAYVQCKCLFGIVFIWFIILV